MLGAYGHLEPGEETDERHRVAGRIAARRGSGKAAFLDLVDRTGKIQLHARQDILGEERYALLTSLDLGDLLGVDGSAMRSRHGEVSLRVEEFQVLGKALRPPPDKHHGLTDVETRYRHRELDLIASAEARRLFMDRARIVSAVRGALDSDGFIEVETPVLQPLYGGAMARPFTTHHNALDRDLYLRIATELYLKRLIVGGLERVYELGKDFRNEGISHKHNPEFTMVEWYEAYADYEGAMARTEAIARAAAEAVSYEGELDFSAPWPRVGFVAAIREATGIALDEHLTAEALAAQIAERGLDVKTERGLVRDGRRPALQVRRAGAACGRRSSSTTRRRSHRWRANAPRTPASWSASRRSPAGWRSPTASASSPTPTSSGSGSPRSSGSRRPPRALPRRCPTTRRSCRRWSRGCRRRPASASAWTGS